MIIRVHGTPAPQGSKRHVGHGVMIESSKAVKPWREAVKWAALAEIAFREENYPEFAGPVQVTATFTFTRPKSHYRTGKNAHLLKPGAPTYVTSKPDLDKIIRSTFDALTDAAVWRDDAQVVAVHALKWYGPVAGVELRIEAT